MLCWCWVVSWIVWVELGVELIYFHKTRDALPYSYSNPAEYFKYNLL